MANSTHDILTISTRSTITLVGGYLHEALFAIGTDGAGLAATLLVSDRSQQDGGNWE
jgi:hypothetical protein